MTRAIDHPQEREAGGDKRVRPVTLRRYSFRRGGRRGTGAGRGESSHASMQISAASLRSAETVKPCRSATALILARSPARSLSVTTSGNSSKRNRRRSSMAGKASACITGSSAPNRRACA